MGQIQGSVVNNFTDQKITVTIRLNEVDADAKTINNSANNFQPVMLYNTQRIDQPENIGNACVVPKNAPLEIFIESKGGICGFTPTLYTMKETIYQGLYFCSTKSYDDVAASVRRYSSAPNFIQAENFYGSNPQEDFQRSQLNINVIELLSYTDSNNVNYPNQSPLSGVSENFAINVLPGGVTKGDHSSETFGAGISNVKTGQQLGSLLISIFIVKDQDAYNAFVKEVPGITPGGW